MITFEDDLQFSNNKIYIDCLKQTLKLINENDVESHGRIHVGDVHGDLFQFLLPLKGLINITGYNQAVNEIEFTINNLENRLIYYHGDLVKQRSCGPFSSLLSTAEYLNNIFLNLVFSF